MGVEHLIVLIVLFVLVVAGVVFMQLGQRQIPTQSAKHVRGRRVYGGNRQYLPLRLNQSGVMPIIFASSLLMLPSLFFSGLVGLMGSAEPGTMALLVGQCVRQHCRHVQPRQLRSSTTCATSR